MAIGTISNGESGSSVRGKINSAIDQLNGTASMDAIGTTVQAYDADTAKYDDATANFTGALQKSGSPVIVSNVTGITGADTITNIVSLTQAEYDAIGSPSASTLYIITDA